MKYYQLVCSNGRWHLGEKSYFHDGSRLDIRAYSRGKPLVNPKRVPFEVIGEGERTDFSEGVHVITVVTPKLAEVWSRIAGHEALQLIPADVEGEQGEWYVAVMLDHLECLDLLRTKHEYHPMDHVNPLIRGKVKALGLVVTDTVRAEGHHLFRLAESFTSLVVSEEMRREMERAGITGCEYWQVAP